jgi:hypothetical protein
MFANVQERYDFVDCGYFTDVNCNIKRHMASKQHLSKKAATEVDKSEYKCLNCNKKYAGQSGLWAHNLKCKPKEVENIVVEPVAVVQKTPELLETRIDKLEIIIAELVKN